MKANPEQEGALIERVLTFKDAPLDFVRFMYPWGEPGTPFEHYKGPRKWQVEDLGRLQDHLQKAARARELGLNPPVIYREARSSGRGPGKSAKFGMLAHWHASCHWGAPTIVAANSENQLRSRTFPEFARWFGAGLNAHWWNIEGMMISPQTWLAEAVAKRPEEGGLSIDTKYWYVRGQMWTEENPNAFAGAHNVYGMLVLFDEADGIPLPIWINTEGFFTDPSPYRIWAVASQMRSNKGAFYDLFYDKKFGAGWDARSMNVEGMEGVDQDWVKSMMEKFGAESDQVRVEVRGLPPRTSEDQFIPADHVRVAMDNELMRDWGEALVIGVDPAPRGRTAIRARQGRNARDPIGSDSAIVLEGYDNVQIAERILQMDHKYKPMYWVIDFGMGTGVIDILKRRSMHGKMVVVRPGDTPHDKESPYGSMAAHLWGELSNWLPGGMIPRDDGSKGTLSHQMVNRGWKWSGREDHKKVLEAKEDLKARGLSSPDDVDALALTFAVNPPRTDRRPAGGTAIRVDGVEENPYGW